MKRRVTRALALVLSLILALPLLLPAAAADSAGIALDEYAKVELGETIQLTARAASNGALVWESSDEAVATVKDGSVTGVGLGPVTITVRCGDASARCLMEVVGPAPAGSNKELRAALPPVEYWNERPTWDLPDPFVFLDGSAVKTQADWQRRAAEIREMLQYYEYGYKPAAPDKLTFEEKVLSYMEFDWGTWQMAPRETDGVLVHLTVGDRTADMEIGIQLPQTPRPAAGYPAVICLGSLGGSNAADFLARGYAVIGLDISSLYNEQTSEGIVKTLFQFDWLADPDAPSALMGWAWGVSRVVDALEAGAYQGRIDLDALAVTGFSRNGKGALVAGAFDERIAIVAPGNAGCGGTSIERFVTPLADPDYYIQTDPEDKSNSHVVLPEQAGEENTRKWTLSEGSQDAWSEEEQRYVPRYQTLSHCREQQDLWFCSRFHQFKQDESVICDPVDVDKWTTETPDNPWVNPKEWDEGYDGPGYGGKGTPFGVLTSLPFDQHFLMALVAPRGLMVHSGFTDDWNNPEGMAFGYYVAERIYRYLDVLYSDEDIYDHVGIFMGDWGHEYPASAANALVNFSNHVLNLQGESYETKAVYQNYPYPADDSRRAEDYARLTWLPITGMTVTTNPVTGASVETVAAPDGGKTITVIGKEGKKYARVALPAQVPAPDMEFEDVQEGHPASEAVKLVAGMELFQGTGSRRFSPDEDMTRATIATVLYRMSGSLPGSERDFSDVSKSAYYAQSVAWAAKHHIISGTEDGRFEPEKSITQEELVVMLYRYCMFLGAENAVGRDALAAFSDSAEVSAWAKDAMEWAKEKQLLGSGGLELSGDERVTRAETAMILARFVEILRG